MDLLGPEIMAEIYAKVDLHIRNRKSAQAYKDKYDKKTDISKLPSSFQYQCSSTNNLQPRSCSNNEQIYPIDYSIHKEYALNESSNESELNKTDLSESFPKVVKSDNESKLKNFVDEMKNIRDIEELNRPCTSKENIDEVTSLRSTINRVSERVSDIKIEDISTESSLSSEEHDFNRVDVFKTLTFCGRKKSKILCNNEQICEIFRKCNPGKRNRSRKIPCVENDDDDVKEKITFDISSLHLEDTSLFRDYNKIEKELRNEYKKEYKAFKDSEWEENGKNILVTNINMRRTNRTRDTSETEYWEKRKKNNQSAKKSRDTRRIRVWEIDTKLKFLVTKNEVLRQMIISEANGLLALMELMGDRVSCKTN